MTCIRHSKLSKQFYYRVNWMYWSLFYASCTFYIYMHSKGFSTDLRYWTQSDHQMAGPGGIKSHYMRTYMQQCLVSTVD